MADEPNPPPTDAQNPVPNHSLRFISWPIRIVRDAARSRTKKPGRRTGLGVFRWASLGIFVYVSFIGANAIAEIQERRSVYLLVSSELREANSRLDQLPGDSSQLSSAARYALSERIASYETALRKLRHLSAAGALDSTYTLTNIRREVEGIPLSRRSYIKDSLGGFGYTLMPEMIDVSADGRMYSFTVLFACVLGCIVQFFRSGSRSPMRTMVVGFGAGIVCYLGIASGKIGPITSDDRVEVATGVLLGFLAGVFSVHVYDMVEKAIGRLKGEANEASSQVKPGVP